MTIIKYYFITVITKLCVPTDTDFEGWRALQYLIVSYFGSFFHFLALSREDAGPPLYKVYKIKLQLKKLQLLFGFQTVKKKEEDMTC